MAETQTTGPEAHWRAALAEGRILLQRDPVSGETYFPPRLTGSEGQSLEWAEASGKGVVYSATQIHPRPPAGPYNVVLVQLEEGARMMSRVDGIGEAEPLIGAAVTLHVAQTDDGPLVVCHLA